MKNYLKLVCAVIAIAAVNVSTIHAGEEKSMVISIETDSFNLSEIDVSSLAIGESKTFETDSGQVVDVLRTLDELEVYIDGALIDTGFDHDPDGEIHMITKHLEISCEDEDGSRCEQRIEIHSHGDNEISTWTTDAGDIHLAHERIDISCIDDEGDIECNDHTFLFTDSEEFDIESFHGEHEEGEHYKVIVIENKKDSDD